MMDPITLDICWSRLIGVVNEQAAALMRTSFTSIVREAGDLSAGVFDRRGYMIAQAVTGTPGHINSMALAMKHILAAYPLERLAPGQHPGQRRAQVRPDGLPHARLELLRPPPSARAAGRVTTRTAARSFRTRRTPSRNE